MRKTYFNNRKACIHGYGTNKSIKNWLEQFLYNNKGKKLGKGEIILTLWHRICNMHELRGGIIYYKILL